MTDEELIVGLKHIGKRVSLPCPDGLEGCLVHHFGIETDPVAARAADRIEALTAENERLREGLNAIIDRGVERDQKWMGMNARDIARAALEKQP